MRNRFVTLAISMMFFIGLNTGIFGCTKDPSPQNDTQARNEVTTGKNADIRTKSPSKIVFEDVKIADSFEKKTPGAEAPTKETPVKAPAEEKTGPVKNLKIEDLPAKETESGPLVPVQGKDKKDKGKEPSKDPTKDPKMPEFKEPSEVLGRKYADWKKEIHSTDPSRREIAMEVILSFGPKKAYEALPEIIAELEKHKKTPLDLSARVNGVKAMSQIFAFNMQKKEPDFKHLEEGLGIYKMFLKDNQIIMKVYALQGLPYLGPTALKAKPDVIAVAKDLVTWEARDKAIQILAILRSYEKLPDKDVVTTVRRAAVGDAIAKKDNSYKVRITAVQALGIILQEDSLADLKKAMLDPDKEVRMITIQTFGFCKEKGIPEVCNALKDKDKEVRLTALTVLSRTREVLDKKGNEKLKAETLQTIAARVDPKTKKGAEEDDILILWTHATFMALTKVSKGHMDPLLDMLNNHKELRVRLQALQIITTIGPDAKPFALGDILKALSDPEHSVASGCMYALVSMHAREAIPELKKIVDNEKMPIFLRETGEDAIIAIESNEKTLKERNKKDKDDKK